MTGHGAGLNGAITNIAASGASFNFGADKFLMLRIDLNKAVSYTKPTNSHVPPSSTDLLGGGQGGAWPGQVYHYFADRK